MIRQPLTVGDRVRYASPFLRTIGAHAGWLPAARGTIARLWGDGFAAIVWDVAKPDGDRTGGAHVSALERCR
jgi:hypothetical protein